MDETMRFRCAQSLIDLVDEHAKRERRSRSNQLRVIVEDWLMDRAEQCADLPPIPGRQTAEEFARGGRTLEQVEDALYGPQLRVSKLVDTPTEYDAEAGK